MTEISVTQVLRDVSTVVLPDNAEETGEEHQWQWIEQRLREGGVATTTNELRALPYRVVLSDGLRSQLELGVATGQGRVLSAKTCNRVLAAVSSFYAFLIASAAYSGRENPIVKVADHAAARSRPIPVAVRQRPSTAADPPRVAGEDGRSVAAPGARRGLRSGAGELPTRRDRALLEMMWEGGLRPGEVLGLQLEDISYGQRIFVRKRNDHPAGVRQKSRRDRVVGLLEGRALPALNDYVMHERPVDAECPWVFLVGGKGQRRCEPMSYDGLVRMFARAAGRAGVRDAWLTHMPCATPTPPHVPKRHAGAD